MQAQPAATTLSPPDGRDLLAERLGPWRRDPVAQRLRGIRFRQQLFNLLALVLAASCAFLCYIILEMLADRRWEFSALTRQTLLSVCLWALGGSAAILAGRVLFRAWNPLFHARAAERALGLDDDILLTYVSLRRARSVSATEAQAAVLLKERAVRRLGFLDTDQVVDARPLLRCLWALGACLLLFLSLYAAWGRTFADSFYRCLMPARRIAPPRLVRIVAVTPGNGVAVAAEPVAFAVEVCTDRLPAEAVLIYRIQGESHEARESLPRATGHGAAQSHEGANGCYAKELPGFIRSVTYWAQCGDARAGPFHLDAVERPLVAAVNVRVLPPPYASGAPVREAAGGHVQAILGSRLEISASVTQPPRLPRLLGDTESAWLQAGAARLPMAVDGKRLTATVPVQRDFEYKIGYVDTGGLASRESILYQVKALPDQPPVAFLRRDDGTEDSPLPANGTLLLRGEASDDLGIRNLTLRAHAVGRANHRLVSCPPPAPAPSVSRALALDLRPFGLREGDTLECVLVAEDVKRPAGQRAESAPLRIPIARPAAAEPDGFEIGRKREPGAEEAPPPQLAERKTPEFGGGETANPVEKLDEQSQELLREIARLAQQEPDEETKREIAELAGKQQQVADEAVALIEKETAAGTPQSRQANAAENGAQENAGKDGRQDGGKEADSSAKQGEDKDANGKPRAGGAAARSRNKDGDAQTPDGESGKRDGQGDKPGEGKNAGNGTANNTGRNAGATGQSAAPGQGRNGKGRGEDQGQGQASGGRPQNGTQGERRAGGGGQTPATSDAQAARKELAQALDKLRAGQADDETVRQARHALDHLFRAGRAFSARDRQRLAELNKDAAAEPGKRVITETASQPPGPAGRARGELTKGQAAGSTIKNVPGELKEDALGQPAEKGQVKIAPEYRKALEDYYKAIAK